MITKKPWFGPRRWGWGWQPIAWEGWLVVLIYLGIISLIARYVTSLNQEKFLIALIVSTIILMIVCYLTGGKPRSKYFNKK